MATLVNVDVEINDSGLQNLLNDLSNDAPTMLEIHNRLAQRCDKYVPWLTGYLASTGIANISPDGVLYNTPYARYQYYGVDFNHTRTNHPLASALWDKQMMINEGDEFVKEIEAILIRRANELYGS